MAKAATPAYGKQAAYPYPSRFGSHASMINESKSEGLEDPTRVVLTDEFGDYETDRKRLDTGLADPNRWDGRRLKVLMGG